MSFRARQSQKALLSASGAGTALYILITYGSALRESDFGRTYPWSSLLLVMAGITALQVLGGLTIYCMQNSGSNPQGQEISRDEFLRYLQGDCRFVLYLRNFATEAGAQLIPRLVERPDQPAPKFTFVPQTLPGIEHALSHNLGGRNRLFAIENRRADTIPIFDLVICDDNSWRSTVALALQKARIVVLAIEEQTPGVIDEIDMVSRLAPERTWLIYSASVRTLLQELPSAPFSTLRWKSHIPSHQSLRGLYHLEFPADIITWAAGEA